MDFLKDVLLEKKRAIKEIKRVYPEEELRLKLEEPRIWKPFKANISQPGKLNIIAEIKRASPSQGLLREDFDLLQIARIYQNSGASAISILTEEKYFSGKIAYLKQARKISELPILRKDFIFESYQLYESKFFGADAVLLITELFKDGRLSEFLALAKRLELDCLVEVNSLDDLKYALDQGSEIIGLNNRNLHTLEIDKDLAAGLITHIPKDRIVIAESAIKTHRDYLKYQKLKFNALLIGSALMKAEDIKKKFSDIVNGTTLTPPFCAKVETTKKKAGLKKTVKKIPSKTVKKSGKPR